MTPAPSARELQVARITGMSPRRQRYWLARGFGLDMFGNVSSPRSDEAAT